MNLAFVESSDLKLHELGFGLQLRREKQEKKVFAYIRKEKYLYQNSIDSSYLRES
jgi:hypothetical protein